jgi:hypothetical protein
MSAPEGEVTAAVERAEAAIYEAIWGGPRDDDRTPDAEEYQDARTALDAALDVEEMAWVISSHRHGSEVPWPEDRRTAEALRAAILGGAA